MRGGEERRGGRCLLLLDGRGGSLLTFVGGGRERRRKRREHGGRVGRGRGRSGRRGWGCPAAKGPLEGRGAASFEVRVPA